jgi:hypothetical protein
VRVAVFCTLGLLVAVGVTVGVLVTVGLLVTVGVAAGAPHIANRLAALGLPRPVTRSYPTPAL